MSSEAAAPRLAAALVDRRLVLALATVGLADGPHAVRVGAPDGPWADAQAAAWPAGTDGAAGSLLLLTVPRGLKGALASLHVEGPDGPLVLAVPPRAVPIDALLREALRAAGGAFPAVAGRLAGALLDLEDTPERVRLAARLAQGAAEPGGLLETVGRFEDGDLAVSGWAGPLPAAEARVLVLAPEPRRGRLEALRFRRPDLTGDRRGFAGVVTAPDAPEAAAVAGLLVETAGGGWRSLDAYADRRILEPESCPGELAAHLAAGEGPPLARAAVLAAACRYTGRDTLSETRRPVRLGLDTALRLPGGGVALVGWIFDPTARVRAVSVAAGARSVRVDDVWTRLPRPDVAPVLAADPLFAGLGEADALQGFLAHAVLADADADGPLRLSVDLGPDGVLHRPLDAAPGTRDALLATLDRLLTLPSAAEAAAARHVLPLLDALAATRAPRAVGVEGAEAEGAEETIVLLGCGPDLADLPARLGLLAADPGRERLTLAIAAPARALRAAAPEIRRLAAWHDLAVRLVFCEDVLDGLDAADAAAPVLRAERLLLLPDHAVPAEPDAVGRLVAAARAAGADAVVAPALVHADGTVRWAGPARKGRPAVGRPIRGRLAVAAPTAEVAVVPRAAFIAAGGFGGPAIGHGARGEALGRRLAALGQRGFFLADVRVTVDDPARPGRRLAAVADRLIAARDPLPLRAGEAA